MSVPECNNRDNCNNLAIYRLESNTNIRNQIIDTCDSCFDITDDSYLMYWNITKRYKKIDTSCKKCNRAVVCKKCLEKPEECVAF